MNVSRASAGEEMIIVGWGRTEGVRDGILRYGKVHVLEAEVKPDPIRIVFYQISQVSVKCPSKVIHNTASFIK